MRDPEEGLNPDGTIRTGARRDQVPAEFEPVLMSAVEAWDELANKHAELHLYGSVATGMARLGVSDVDLLAIGVPERWARDLGAALSGQFSVLCRAVEIGRAAATDFHGRGDAAYGNRVFLRHFCVPLAGSHALHDERSFPGDVRAARGFNGDIKRCLDRWRSGADARRAARKTLLATAGLISVHDGVWTTDRGWSLGRTRHGSRRLYRAAPELGRRPLRPVRGRTGRSSRGQRRRLRRRRAVCRRGWSVVRRRVMQTRAGDLDGHLRTPR